MCAYTYMFRHTHTYIMFYYSTIKNNEILASVTTQMDLKGTALGEISQTSKDKYCMVSLICGIKKKQAYRYREQIGGCQKWGVEGGRNG